MKRILIPLLLFNACNICLAQTPTPETEIELLKQIKTELVALNKGLNNESAKLDDLNKKIDGSYKTAVKKNLGGYLYLKKETYIKIYDIHTDTAIERQWVKKWRAKKYCFFWRKCKQNKRERRITNLSDYNRYEHILVDSIQVFITDKKTESVTVFYEDNIINNDLKIEFKDFKNDQAFNLNTTRKIKLNEIINYIPILMDTEVKERVISLSPNKKTVVLTKK